MPLPNVAVCANCEARVCPTSEGICPSCRQQSIAPKQSQLERIAEDTRVSDDRARILEKRHKREKLPFAIFLVLVGCVCLAVGLIEKSEDSGAAAFLGIFAIVMGALSYKFGRFEKVKTFREEFWDQF